MQGLLSHTQTQIRGFASAWSHHLSDRALACCLSATLSSQNRED
nr:hypothetical protein [Phytobacter sp.]